MDVVRELYIEAMLRLKQKSASRPVAIGDDDRWRPAALFGSFPPHPHAALTK